MRTISCRVAILIASTTQVKKKTPCMPINEIPVDYNRETAGEANEVVC